MRPNNQNKRSRGRNNGGRKHSNPLSRNFESNGPDVKVRGNAAHVAEKYVQLARDAQASGDSVMAENYLQHAEHYFRLISAAQAQMAPRSDQPQSASDDDDDTDMDNDGSETRSGDAPRRQRQEAEANSGDDSGGEAGDDGEDRTERKPRRPRRKPRSAEPAAANAGDGPQPDVGELPAFLTSGTANAAE